MNKEESSDDLDNHSSEEIDESKKIEEDNKPKIPRKRGRKPSRQNII